MLTTCSRSLEAAKALCDRELVGTYPMILSDVFRKKSDCLLKCVLRGHGLNIYWMPKVKSGAVRTEFDRRKTAFGESNLPTKL